MTEVFGWAAALGGAAGALVATAAVKDALRDRRRHKLEWDDSFRRMTRRLASIHGSDAGRER